MTLFHILTFAQNLLKERVQTGDIVVDCTCGNGNDTLFLAQLVGKSGKVYGFDIQQQAIEKTKELLKEHQLLDQVKCIQDSHEHITQWINEPITAAMFNLGYLPGGDKKITTHYDTTIKAIEGLLPLLKVNGLITIALYVGHDVGNEAKEVEKFLMSLPQKQFSVLKYQFINQVNFPPYLIVVEKKK
ncbi:class I SAM-dependent methyltransferase [Tepidibacillus infernus]|uniref:tRNA (mnm(5)s(2)U34)-methyltransferase n=1 Tax=Tepidibacillus TaxID=1494427 RepID=UPI0008529766|nr:class I SAM-dependent methyltransferase [Tepidibacillus sp. HK-1]GBF11332.1 cobalt-precorrin-6Y C(15)-methyltransferase [Tepidibacillus sp. HK-1]